MCQVSVQGRPGRSDTAWRGVARRGPTPRGPSCPVIRSTLSNRFHGEDKRVQSKVHDISWPALVIRPDVLSPVLEEVGELYCCTVVETVVFYSAEHPLAYGDSALSPYFIIRTFYCSLVQFFVCTVSREGWWGEHCTAQLLELELGAPDSSRTCTLSSALHGCNASPARPKAHTVASRRPSIPRSSLDARTH